MNEDHSVRRLVEELSNAALRDLLRNVRHHTELRRRIAAGLLDERSVNQAYREYAQREGPSYRQQAADLTLQYYGDITELGNEYSERFYQEVLDAHDAGVHASGTWRSRATNGDGEVERDAQAGEEVPVELHGPSGREVVARFGLENPDDHPIDVTLEVGPCRGPHDEPFLAPLTVTPAATTVQPGETRQITLRVLLLPAVFVPGHLYRVPITVRGADVLRLLVTIWAEEPDHGLRLDDNVAPPSDVAAGPADAGLAAERVPRVGAAPSPAKTAATAPTWIVRCPACGREFPRQARTTRLYPHKTPQGEPCPARAGTAKAAR